MSELEGYFFAELDTVSFGGKSVSKSAKNKRGRRSKQYMLLPLESVLSAIVDWATPRIIETLHPTTPDDEDAALAQPTADMFKAVGMPATQAKAVAEHLRKACEREYLQTPRLKRALERELARLRGGMRVNRSTELPAGWALGTAADYRAAFLRATNDENERRSRREIQDLLGVSNGSVGDMLRRAGLVRRVEGGEYEEHPITQPRGIEKQVTATARKVKGFPRAIVVTGTDGKQTVSGYSGADSARISPHSSKTGHR